MIKGSDLFVAALENEGVDRIFGVPGEENLDVVESLRNSRIELVLTRHEQAAAFMAATHGRLTGRPGVCLATLGPGALNFSTGAAYAHLGAMPMILITGQKPIMSAKQARFQIVDVVASMKPLTKMTRQIVSAASIPATVRDAFRVAMEERPGPVHLELPEDVAAEEVENASVIPVHPLERPVAQRRRARPRGRDDPRRQAAAGDDRRGRQPASLVEPLSAFVRRTRLPFFNTQMGKGAVTGGSNLYMGTAALSEGDYVHEAVERADLIIAIGHDTVEKPPFLMKSAGGPKVDPCRLPVRHRRTGLPPRYRGDRRYRRHRRQRSPTGSKASCPPTQGDARSAPEDPRPHQRPRRGGPLPGHAAAHRPRRAQGHAGGRHRLPRQRHVQDLVRPQLPHPCRQHAAARQCAGHDGRRPALGDDGGDAVPRATRHGGLRRWRLHDELAGDGNGGAARAEPRRGRS